MSKENSKTAKLNEQARKTSIKEGCFSVLTSSFGDNFAGAFAVAIKSTPFQISFLTSLPNLFSPIAQSFGSKWMEHHSRKKIVTRFVFWQALIWIPIAILALLFMFSIFTSQLPIALVILYTSLAILGGLTVPAWFSWMGDIIPENEKGKYFTRRNKITGFVSLIALLAGAFLLDFFEKKSIAMVGFFILFILAALTRLAAYKFFKQQYCPKFKLKKEYYFSFWNFVLKYRNFTKFSVYNAFLNLATCIAGPFFTVYMLRELQFSYTTFMAVVISGALFTILFTPLAGKFSDKYGNLKLIYIANVLFILIPILWIFTKNPWAIILGIQLIGGATSAAWAISTTNFIYDTVTPQRRGICIAYMGILVGAGIFIGSTLGGLILDSWHPSPNIINPFLFVFAVSALFRLISLFVFLPQIKEIKKFKSLPPFLAILRNPIRQFYD